MKPDVWLRSDYQHNIALGEVHLVRASKEQHDDDFVPLYDSETVDRLRAELAEVKADRDATRLEREALQVSVHRLVDDLVVATAAMADAETDRDALRAFARDVLATQDDQSDRTLWQLAEEYSFVQFDEDADRYIETPLLTGEPRS